MALPLAGATNMPSALPEPVMGLADVASTFFPIRTSASVPICLLQMPHIRQDDHNGAGHDAVHNENAQAVGLQVANQPGNRSVTDNRGNDNADEERRMHARGQALLAE